jgi:small subunit ribosomal protein S18
MSNYDSSNNSSGDSRNYNNQYSDNRGPYRGSSDRGGSDRGSSDRDGYRGSKTRSYFRKKVCRFCTQNYQMDYKKPETLQRFLTDRGKILPRRITGTCAKHQRHLATVIKRARALALLPFVKQ